MLTRKFLALFYLKGFGSELTVTILVCCGGLFVVVDVNRRFFFGPKDQRF